MAVLPQRDLDKLSVLANYVTPSIFQHIEDCTDYRAAAGTLQALFVKPRNEIFARHILATRCQQPHETLDEFLQALKTLSKVCNSRSVNGSKYNTEKCIFSTWRLPVFGYIIEEDTIRPDPDRLRPLCELPVPRDSRSMSRCLGLFSYYSQWIPRFPIASCKSFPLPPLAVEAYESLKKTTEDAVVTALDETIPFEVETDASEVALVATLNQNRRPNPSRQ